MMHARPELNTISHVDRLASQTKNERLATALTVLSVALVASMALNQFMEIYQRAERGGRGR